MKLCDQIKLLGTSLCCNCAWENIKVKATHFIVVVADGKIHTRCEECFTAPDYSVGSALYVKCTGPIEDIADIVRLAGLA